MTVNPDATTRNYDPNADGQNYAKVAELAIGLFGEAVYQHSLTATIRLYSYSNADELVLKEYGVAFSKTSARVRDLTPGTPGPQLVATMDNGIGALYTSPSQPWVPVQMQIVQCNRPQLIHALPSSGFVHDLAGLTVHRPANAKAGFIEYPFVYQNGWTRLDGQGRQYSRNGIVYVSCVLGGGTLPPAGGSITPLTLPVPTTEGKEFGVTFQAGAEYKAARARITGAGAFQLLGVTDNTRVLVDFDYRMTA